MKASLFVISTLLVSMCGSEPEEAKSTESLAPSETAAPTPSDLVPTGERKGIQTSAPAAESTQDSSSTQMVDTIRVMPRPLSPDQQELDKVKSGKKKG